ncbi:Acetyl-coenzyme A synthetase, cytoplasmic [Chamberlinius hualienensis]
MGSERDQVFFPSKEMSDNAYIKSLADYKSLYQLSIDNPNSFWKDIVSEFKWSELPAFLTSEDVSCFDFNFDILKGPIQTKWFAGGKTNICYNVLDRIVKDKKMGNKIAYYWEGNEVGHEAKITYEELYIQVCKFANILKEHGVKKGDRVAIYMPMIFELVVAMLACARIGAIHSIVFGGFSSDSLSSRILDAECRLIVTADGTWRGPKLIDLKEIVDEALEKCSASGHKVDTCIVVRHFGKKSKSNGVANGEPRKKEICHQLTSKFNEGVDLWWHDLMENADAECEPVWMDVEDPLFMLYTSGSTGKPKGVIHTIGGYMVYVATTFKYVFNYLDDDIYWCTADIGWITGHSYVVYGPMLYGATSVMFEGIPVYPDAGRFWQIVQRYKVNSFYTAPTAIRSLMKFGDSFVTQYDRSSLKILGTVGEPINPEAWLWYHNVIGNGKCAIVDTFWQTETGGHVITPLPGATPTKPGSATFPFFGVVPSLLDESGKEIEGPGEGYLVFNKPWPGIMRTVYGDHDRFEKIYFSKFPGFYCTGDGARRDEDGYFWLTGRIDDMLNVSGHLLSTAEVESALIEHKAIAESAVVASPHEVKGECLYCFVTLKEGFTFTDKLIDELKLKVRSKIGPFAAPEYIQNAPGLPKTRSGKIMRRILRKIAVNDHDLGDTSTLADESIVNLLFQLRPPQLCH